MIRKFAPTKRSCKTWHELKRNKIKFNTFDDLVGGARAHKTDIYNADIIYPSSSSAAFLKRQGREFSYLGRRALRMYNMPPVFLPPTRALFDLWSFLWPKTMLSSRLCGGEPMSEPGSIPHYFTYFSPLGGGVFVVLSGGWRGESNCCFTFFLPLGWFDES